MGCLRTGTRPYVKLLLEKGAEVETKDNTAGRRCHGPLQRARGYRRSCCSRRAPRSRPRTIMAGRRCRGLLRTGTRPSSSCCSRRAPRSSQRIINGRTPLSWAAETGTRLSSSCCSRRALRSTPKDNTAGRRCRGLLRTGKAVVKLLLEKGAELETKDTENGRTLLL